MFNLYADCKTIFREYIQNAMDSIYAAVEQGLLPQVKDGKVEITINAEDKRIIFQDNGTGITLNQAPTTLLNISASKKDGVNQAGQFGVGRLVGGGYCHRLVFKTTAKGEEKGTKVVFDMDRIWCMIRVDDADYLATEVMERCVTVEQFPAKTDEHYFIVILEDVKKELAPELLQDDTIIHYLNEIAPVDYKPEFKNTVFKGSLLRQTDFCERYDAIEKTQVFVNGTKVVKQYGLKIVGTGDDIKGLEFFKIVDQEYGLLAWGWYALTKFSKQIKDDLAGFRLRKHNIQIGKSNILSEYWSETRSNYYFYGEVFVVHPNICPNTARDGLVATPEVQAFYNHLKDYFKELRKIYEKASKVKSAINNMVKAADNIKKKNGKEDLLTKYREEYNKIKKGSHSAPVTNVIAFYEDDFQHALLIAEQAIVSVSKNTPKDSEISTKTAVQPKTSEANDPHTSQDPNTPDPKREVKGGSLIDENLISELDGVLPQDKRELISRVFHLMSAHCPKDEHNQKLILQLQKMIIKELKRV